MYNMINSNIEKNSGEKSEETKRVVPVLSLEEFLQNEVSPKDKKIMGAIKIRKEDADRALKYFENR